MGGGGGPADIQTSKERSGELLICRKVKKRIGGPIDWRVSKERSWELK
jgi:hypothetical protein